MFTTLVIASIRPSEDQLLEDYYQIYLGYEAYEGHTLDTSICNITENDLLLFPDQQEEEQLGYNIIRTSSFDISEVEVNYYDGFYTDTLFPQCVILISDKNFYPAGPTWGLPGSVLLLYTQVAGEWILSHACPFYHKAEMIVFNEKSKISSLYVNIDYSAMGVLQWVECIYRFEGNKPAEIYYELTSDDSMREQMRYMEDRGSFKNYKGGDTLSAAIHIEDFRDIDGDGVKEMICNESLTISGKPRKNELQMKYCSRELIYDYKDGQLLLRKPGSYICEEKNK